MSDNLPNALYQELLGQSSSAVTEATANRDAVCARLIASGMTIAADGTISAAIVSTTPNVTAATGTLPVTHGGTGVGTLTGLVVGNGTSVMSAVTAPAGAVVGTTDAQALSNKTIAGASNTLTVRAASDITGQLPATNGGTGLNLSAFAVDNQICDGRLTLTTATPVTTADVTGATNVFYTPYKGNRIALYDGAAQWNILTFSELTQALGTLTSGLPYDVFAFNNSGVVATEILAWTSTTARATALVLQDGVLVKSGATTRRYLGTFYTTATTTTEDSAAKRYVWNYYHRVRRTLHRHESTNGWTYTTATLRQANAAAANQVEVLIGVAEVLLELEVGVVVHNSTGGIVVTVGIGEDSTSTALGNVVGGDMQAFTTDAQVRVQLRRFPAIGRHFYAWLETSAATGTTTWGSIYNTAGNGMNGSMDG